MAPVQVVPGPQVFGRGCLVELALDKEIRAGSNLVPRNVNVLGLGLGPLVQAQTLTQLKKDITCN